MFQDTRIRLVMLNAIVFIIIFNLSGAILYFYAKYHLFHNIDIRLQNIGERIKNKSYEEFEKTWDQEREGDQLIFYLLTDSKGNVYQFPPVSIPENIFPKLTLGSSTTRSIASIQAGPREFRVLNIPVKMTTKSQIIKEQIVSIQIIRSLYPEQTLLEHLTEVMPIVSIVGAVIAVLAGFFLAGRALIPIRDAWEKQQRFVADASHELRTPLAVMQMNTEIMLRYPKHTIEEESETISAILKELRRTSNLVSHLLTLARSDNNELQIKQEKFALDKTIQEMVGHFRMFAEMKHITIHASIDDDISFIGDEERIRQLLVILLDNAIKYTPDKGKITVSCHKRQNNIELVITDTGIGISKKDLPYVFDRFYRGDKVRSRAEGGTGLGLSIAKWIVGAHHGKINILSTLGVGTSTYVTFSQKSKG